MAVTKYESYYAKISENIKGIREYNEYNTRIESVKKFL